MTNLEGPLRQAAGEAPAGHGAATDRGCHRRLEDAVASEIITRLFLVHRLSEEGVETSPDACFREGPVLPLGEIEHGDFLAYIRQGDVGSAALLLDELLARGISNRQLLCDMMGGAAARLGELWDEDEADFAEVTMALCSLHRVLRERDWVDGGSEEGARNGLAVLITTLEGEQHIFGSMIAAELFRRAGWNVTTMAGGSRENVCTSLGEGFYHVLGISSTHLQDTEEAACDVMAFRAASRNRSLKVVAGGQAFVRDRKLYTRIGADAMAEDVEDLPFWRLGCS